MTSTAKKTPFYLCLIIILALPSFTRMLRSGIFTMHDFHAFRLRQYHLCIQDRIFPCRWAPDSTWQYGQPLFNFYGQLPYLLGEPFQLLHLQTLDTLKILFILSLIGSAITMFFLSRQVWKSSLAGLLSAILYIYAPYRAVDIWVRGALPEALAFILFPLAIYFFNKFVHNYKKTEKPKTTLLASKIKNQIPNISPSLLWFSLSLALLILTHNLSFLMFLVFAVPWSLYLLAREKKLRLILPLSFAGVFSLSLSTFYLLPVILETKHIALQQITHGYYNYQIHFVTLQQLLLSRFWGYGGSTWGPNDTLSFSIGHLQWLLPTIFTLFTLIKLLSTILNKKSISPPVHHQALVLTSLGWLALFLTHGRSLFIWKLAPPLTYIQFPWRFLGIATFSFSLAAGTLPVLLPPKLKKISVILLLLSVILLNQSFFKPDIWRKITDRQQFSGKLWQEQLASASGDFWPATAPKIPHSPAPSNPIINPPTSGTGKLTIKKSHSAQYQLSLSQPATIQFPIVYFPGWKAFANSQETPISPSGNYGLITTSLPAGNYQINLKFTNTPPRTIGNLISAMSFTVLAFLLLVSLQIIPRSRKNTIIKN